MKLFLYLLTQSSNRGYDTFDSCVVVAKSAKESRNIHPYGDIFGVMPEKGARYNRWNNRSWAATPDDVKTECIGVADKSLKENTVVCASFNAG